MPDEHPHDLIAAYALDAVDAHERAEVDAHLAGCAACREELESHLDVAAALADSVSATPPPTLRSAVLAEVAATPQETVTTTGEASSGGSAWRPVTGLLVAAASLVIAGMFFFGVRSGDDLRQDVVDAPDAVVVELEPTDAAERGMLEVTWSADRDAISISGVDLDDPGPGMAYALWFLVDDGVAPAGLFTPTDGTVNTAFAVDDRPTNGWGITIEPESGSSQPTTPVLFAGTI